MRRLKVHIADGGDFRRPTQVYKSCLPIESRKTGYIAIEANSEYIMEFDPPARPVDDHIELDKSPGQIITSVSSEDNDQADYEGSNDFTTDFHGGSWANDGDDDEDPDPEPEPEPEDLFTPTGQIVSASYWWADGPPTNIGAQAKTIDLPAYRRKDEVLKVGSKEAHKRYFQVPAGIISPERFYISEETLAMNLLVRKDMEGMSMKKVRINVDVAGKPGSTYTGPEAKAEFKKQLQEGFWKDFHFEGFKPSDGKSEKITGLVEKMALKSDNEVGKCRTWTKFLQIVRQKTSTKFDVKVRFWQPKLPAGKPKYKIYFLPTKTSVATAQQLKTAVGEALAELKNPVFDAAITTSNEIKSLKLRRIGHNFFNVYDTYMSGPEYWRIVLASYTDASGKRTLGANPDPYKNKDPWPVRVWPSRGSTGVDTIEAKFKKLWRNPVRMEILSPRKIVAITPKRTRGQAQVMGYTSATDVAKTLWPHYLTTPEQVRLSPKWNVEWLHRIAHSYAGDQGQHKSNLIFGTSECNTDMIRSEILVRRFVLLAPDHWQLILRTTMKDTLPHGHVRWCSEYILNQGGDMPVEPDKYAWATPFLEYKFVMSIPDSTIVESWDVLYDTMSRYVPLRFEVDVDEILMNRFMDYQIARFVGK